MAPEVCKSDIIIAIHPKHVANIVSRVKNHEFRKYLLPAETSPASSVKYVATISAGKRPGEIRDPNGLRNDEFDQGRLEHLVKYAYEIRRLEALTAPISLSDLKQNGWLNGPPQKYCYVKQSMRQAFNVAQTNLVFDSSMTALADGPTSSDGQPDVEPERDQSRPQGEQSSLQGKARTVTSAATGSCSPSNSDFFRCQKRRTSPTVDSARQGSLHSWLEKHNAIVPS
ncbi:hypothetical protein QBC43DRAFT_296902 [Cladorrhinum sp. PSN259]|nr:hypothetical protein QBC43DRAFT_296902 [Cladorrhinum sp. PSN259]